jgi:hypothetical protein
VPSNLLSRLTAAFVMMFAVVFLAFPNMLIGSNFEEVHQTWKREKARKALGRLFRFVRYVVRFVRMWRDFRIHGNLLITRMGTQYNVAHSFTPQRSSQVLEVDGDIRVTTTKTLNFVFRAVDFPHVDYASSFSKLSEGNVSVTLSGIPVSEVLLRLVQVFSCAATVEELYESFLLEPLPNVTPRQHDLAMVACHLANSGIVDLFVLNRHDERMLLFISKKGFTALAHCAEDRPLDCVRCFAESREIWERTAGTLCPLSLPLDGFRRWQSIQASVPIHRMGFSVDLKSPESRANSVFRDAIRVKRNAGKHSKRALQCCACPHCFITATAGRCRDDRSFAELLQISLRIVDAELDAVEASATPHATMLPEAPLPGAVESPSILVGEEHRVSPKLHVHDDEPTSAFPRGDDQRPFLLHDIRRRNSWDAGE